MILNTIAMLSIHQNPWCISQMWQQSIHLLIPEVNQNRSTKGGNGTLMCRTVSITKDLLTTISCCVTILWWIFWTGTGSRLEEVPGTATPTPISGRHLPTKVAIEKFNKLHSTIKFHFIITDRIIGIVEVFRIEAAMDQSCCTFGLATRTN